MAREVVTIRFWVAEKERLGLLVEYCSVQTSSASHDSVSGQLKSERLKF